MNSSFELRQTMARIADQHRGLTKAVSALGDTMARDSVDAATVLAMLTNIQDAAARHFADEERLMESVNYPWLPTHRMNHRWFTKFVADYMQGVTSGVIAINEDARRNLPNLVKFHLSSRDDEFETWLDTVQTAASWAPWTWRIPALAASPIAG